jgi:FkbM family methyltransferase
MLASIVESCVRLYSRLAPTERGGYRLARFARRSRPRDQWKDVFHTPDDLRLELDLGTYPDCCMAYGLYELTTARLIQRLLRPGGHFVDGGANLGYYSIMAARCVGPTGQVDAFEPEPTNRARLLANIERNRFTDRIRVHDQALSDKAGTATIHFYEDDKHNHGASSLFAEPGAATRDTDVPTARMDEVLAGCMPNLIKLDIEGAEPLAIAGMTGLLETDAPPAVIAEYNTEQARTAGFEPIEFVRRLLQARPDYQAFVIGRRPRPIKIDGDELASRDVINLLFAV